MHSPNKTQPQERIITAKNTSSYNLLNRDIAGGAAGGSDSVLLHPGMEKLAVAQKFGAVAPLACKVAALQAVAVHVKELLATLALVIEDIFEVSGAEHPAACSTSVEGRLCHNEILPGGILLGDLPK